MSRSVAPSRAEDRETRPTELHADSPARRPRTGALVRAAVAGAALLAVLALVVGWLVPQLNPFRTETIDRSGPALLKSLTDLSEYHAATGHYEAVVDIENDTQWLPDLVSGERILYVGKGDVDALVRFDTLDATRVTVSADRTGVSVKLPSPTVGKPTLDVANSYVYDLDFGLINKFTGSDLEKRAQLKAIEQMSASALQETKLLELAEQNTTSMLTGLFTSLGFTSVNISFN